MPLLATKLVVGNCKTQFLLTTGRQFDVLGILDSSKAIDVALPACRRRWRVMRVRTVGEASDESAGSLTVSQSALGVQCAVVCLSAVLAAGMRGALGGRGFWVFQSPPAYVIDLYRLGWTGGTGGTV